MTEMTKKQRLLNAMRREPVDRLPVQLDFSPLMLDKMCDYYHIPQNGEEGLLNYLDNHIVYAFLNDTYGKLRKRLARGVKEMFDDWGVGWDMTQEGIYLTHHPLENMDNYVKYEFPKPGRDGIMDFTVDTIGKYKNDYVVSSYQVTLLFERAYSLRGYENFLVDLMIEQDFAEELLEKITLYQIETAKNYVRLGVECGRTGDDYGTQAGMLFSPELWRRLFKPRLKRIIDVYKNEGLPVIHHSCGDIRPIIPDLIETGVDVLNNIQPEAMPKEELIEKYGKQLSFYGGISTQKTLPYGSREDIRNEIKDVIDVLGKYNGYIVSPGISITSDVPFDNVFSLIDAIKEYNALR